VFGVLGFRRRARSPHRRCSFGNTAARGTDVERPHESRMYRMYYPAVSEMKKKDSPPDEAELARRRAWFEQYAERLKSSSVVMGPEDGPHRCPCCGERTLRERGEQDICQVCYWQDDGQDDHDADVVRGGPNGWMSLTQARENFRRFGWCYERPLPEDLSRRRKKS
jgi:hypothetical protein